MAPDDDRIRAMLRGRRAVRIIPFPGMDEDSDADAHNTVGVRVLLEEHIDEARADANQYVHARAKALRLDPLALLSVDAEILDREITRQLVFRAFVTPETAKEEKPALFFKSPQEMRQLDSVMVETLLHIYLDHQNYVNPLRGLDQAQAEELVDALGKGSEIRGAMILGQYDALSLRRLVRSMAARLAK